MIFTSNKFFMSQISVARSIDFSLNANFDFVAMILVIWFLWWCDLWAFFEIISHSKSPRSSVVVISFISGDFWLLDQHAHTLQDKETRYQSSGNVVVWLFIILSWGVLLQEEGSSLWKSCLCEHVAWNDMIHLEMGSVISIFIFTWNTTVSNKDRERIRLCQFVLRGQTTLRFYENRPVIR